MRFKKIYLEVTNVCNLDCLFCPGNNRDKKFIDINKFKSILNKLGGWTKYLYFHLMGEPLMHPEINKLIDMASDNFKVNITTNGYLIDRIANNKNIRQVNISLQSFDSKKNVSFDHYIDNIFNSVDKLSESGTIINYRMWVKSQFADRFIDRINEYYKVDINGNTKIRDNIYMDFDTEFIWPDTNNDYYNEVGSCKGLIDHIGILVDGSVVPCCLDYNGGMVLGNIYNQSLDEIMGTKKVLEMINGFRCNKKCEEMCKHCNFYDRIRSQKEAVEDGKK